MTENEAALLDFEEAHPAHDSRKEALIRETFALSAVRYYQRLYRLIDLPDTMKTHASLVKRLQRSRARTLAARSARTPI